MADIASFRVNTNALSVAAGSYIKITGTLIAPVGAPYNVPTYNSFAIAYDNQDGFTRSGFEPPKGGFVVQDDGLGSLGNFAFLDTNANNCYDVGEEGINDILVK